MIPQIGLIDGPLVEVNRTVLVKRMASDLVRFQSFADEADAIRSLTCNGYRAVDVFMMIDDARQVAMQSVVAAEMVKP